MSETNRASILIVDDEENILDAVTIVLRDRFDITSAGRGDLALDLFRKGSFDLVISDVRMPGLDGIELFRKVKDLKPDQKFVFISVSRLFQDNPESLKILTEEAVGFLSKPYRISELLELVESVLGA
jgi:DNA-binding NtrC family response regulator